MSYLIKVNEVIRELIMESHDEESWLHNTREPMIMFHVRNSYSTLIFNHEMSGNSESLEIVLQDGWKLPLPINFLRLVRLSGIDADGNLHPLFLGEGIRDSGTYLLDSENNIMLTSGGIPLMTRNQIVANNTSSNTSGSGGEFPMFTSYGRKYYQSSGVKSVNGNYKVNKKEGHIVITDSPFTTFVLDYVINPMELAGNGIANMSVSKEWKEAVKAMAYYAIIEKKRRVSENEKARAEKRYKELTKIAKLRSAPSIREYLQWLNRSNGGAVKI